MALYDKIMLYMLQLRLDEKSRENSSLSRQLEAALADSRRVTEQSRDKAACKVRNVPPAM